jgi:hypothetical protein
MEQFIATLIFTLPGLMCYFWFQWFGINPSQKHNTFEMLGISALLWIPVSVLTLITYNIIVLLSRIDYVDLQYIRNVDDLQSLIQTFGFILFFIIASVFFSYLLARIWSRKIHGKLIDHINKIRVKNGISAFSKSPTVWEEVFVKHSAKVLEITKLDKQEEKIIGCMEKASRPLEPERNLVLNDVDFFTKIIARYHDKVKVDHVFIDTKAGLMIKVFNPDDITYIQDLNDESDDPIS